MDHGTNWTTVLVALVTGMTAIGGNALLARLAARREQRSVRAGLLAEVAALLEVIEKRGFLESLRNQQGQLESMNAQELHALNPRDWAWLVPINDQYNRVYQQNVTRLGSLSAAEAGQIVRFYQLCDAVKSDVSEGGALAVGSVNFEVYKDAADILAMALRIGRELIQPKPSRWARLIKRGHVVDVPRK